MCLNDTTASRAAAESALRSSRRNLLRGAAALAGGAAVAAAVPGLTSMPAAAASSPAAVVGDRLVMLGVDGGPVPRPGLAKPALALVVNGRVYLVDAGLNVAEQLVASGLGFDMVRHVFVTHHHFDHTSGLMSLAMHGWVYAPSRLRALHLWGPPGMKAVKTGLKEGFAKELELFSYGDAFGTFPSIKTDDIVFRDAGPGPRATKSQSGEKYQVKKVMEDDNVIVHATKVYHGREVKDAFAYRFTIKSSGKRVVFSGDTDAPNPALISLAKGADIIVHEAQDNDNVEKVVASIPAEQQKAFRHHLLTTHSDVRDLPRVAAAAGAGRLVMSHYTPFPQPGAVYLQKAQAVANEIGYTGQLIAPKQLEVITI
jgi:ribonuclease BN (tRNA processing enzyme)